MQKVRDTIELIVSFPPVIGLEGYSIKVGFDNSVVSIDDLNGYKATDWTVDLGIGGISGDNLVIDAGMYNEPISTSTQRQVSEFVFNIIDTEAISAVFTVYLSDYNDSTTKMDSCNYIIGTYEINDLRINWEEFLEYKNNEDETGIIITGYDSSISGSFEIPSEIDGLPVTGIEDYAFSDCASLTGITIPDSVTSIGNSAFKDCTLLTGITIPDSITSIGYWTFCGCTSLTDITIPDSVTSIGDYAFYDCSSLTGITIPGSVTSIGGGAFKDCALLTSITIPDSITDIESWTFCGCTSLTDITIPDSVTSIGDYAFYYCSSLTGLLIPDSITSIGNNAFSGCTSLTVFCLEGSVTEEYATNHSINYEIFVPLASLLSGTDFETGGTADIAVTSVRGLSCSEAVSQFSGDGISIFKNGVQLGYDDFVGTGCELRLMSGETLLDTLTLVVEGDINGDSVVDSLDVFLTDLAMNEHMTLTGIYFEAANLDAANSALDENDLSAIMNLAVGKSVPVQ